MAVSVLFDVVHVPFVASPELAFAPEGIFTGDGSVTGDGSGSSAVLSAQTDRGPEFLYLLDAVAADCVTGEGGEGLITYTLYRGEGNVAALAHYRTIGSFNTSHGRRYIQNELEPPNMLLGKQRSSFQAEGPLTIVEFNFQLNVNTIVYSLVVTGRYYRRSLIHQPGFLRAVLGRG